jgi:hypothetical protein
MQDALGHPPARVYGTSGPRRHGPRRHGPRCWGYGRFVTIGSIATPAPSSITVGDTAAESHPGPSYPGPDGGSERRGGYPIPPRRFCVWYLQLPRAGRHSAGIDASRANTNPGYHSVECFPAPRSRQLATLLVSPTTTVQHGDIQNAGPPVVDLSDQTEGSNPLSLLRALLTGRGA